MACLNLYWLIEVLLSVMYCHVHLFFYRHIAQIMSFRVEEML
jgi:hypothetical protein